MVSLEEYQGEKELAVNLIQGFWLAHNNYNQPLNEAEEDLCAWTNVGHKFYFIIFDNEKVGFIHIGSRGSKIDWLEDIFVKPVFQNKGIGTKAIALIEEIISSYSKSIYIEAAARNEPAIKLYRKLGFNCLNTITIRKDFQEKEFDVIKKEQIFNEQFEIRKLKSNE